MHCKRREQPRLKFGVVVKDRKRKRSGKTKDVSIDGCFIEKQGEFKDLLPIGSRIELILDFPNADRKIKVWGVVKHHGKNNNGMGIRFEKIDDQAIAVIEQFIRTFLDDVWGEEWAKTKEEYWDEVDRLKEKIPHKDHQA